MEIKDFTINILSSYYYRIFDGMRILYKLSLRHKNGP